MPVIDPESKSSPIISDPWGEFFRAAAVSSDRIGDKFGVGASAVRH